ncbi:hypothetical protein REPUB_Repub03eG0074600 [Reevesia pubescens]
MEPEKGSEPKKWKIHKPPPRRIVSSPASKTPQDPKLISSLTVPEAQTIGISSKIQQAKYFAVAQAQQDGCVGNFKIFDSRFGNFLVPVIPSWAELTG